MNSHVLSRSAIAISIGISVIVLSLATITITPAAAQPRSVMLAPAASTSSTVCFVNQYSVACVDRPTLSASTAITDEIRSLTRWLIAGPTNREQAQGVVSSLPIGTQLDHVSVIDNQVMIDLVLPDASLATLTDQQVEDINEQFHTTFTPYNFQRIQINARGSHGGLRLLSDFLPKIEQPHKETFQPQIPFALATQNAGGLSNKTVFVSAGHGWQWNSTFSTYKTQRPMYPSSPYPSGEGIIEDFNNAESVNQYLLPYLQNAGAEAWTVRERDMNTQMIIVDDSNTGFSTQGAWVNNSGGYSGTYRSTTTVNAAANATATWTFTPPITATYAVYVRFPSAAVTRTVDAHFFVEHAGAIAPITITQARDSNNWRFIGNYPFYGAQPAHISLNNQSATSGVTVLADAVRIGGGMADTSAPDTAIISGKPRWEEQAWTYAKWVGLPNVGTLNDVIVRPIFSEWEKEAGEDAVYLSWHTNGDSGYTTARGTTSYIYLTPTQNSTLLQSSIHSELVNEIHAGWDNAWPDRGQGRLNLGEVRLLSTMPGVLLENGFHDNPTDVEAMKDPRFLQLSARAIYHGLVNYWHTIDPNVPLIYLPEPPQKALLRNSGGGQITIEWQPGPIDGAGPLGDAATSYRIYTSTDGFGWSNPIEVAATSYTLAGLLPNQLIFAKVAGINAGGESFASPVLAARTGLFGPAHMLLVYGFDRIDRYGDTQQNDPPEGYSRRVFVDRINRFDAIVQHAEVITLPFDSAQQAAVSSGSIGLGSYTIVDWIAGENQAPAFPALTANDQTALTNFLNSGGALFISGSEIGYELQGTPFYANTLRASYVADDAQTYTANSTAGGLFNGLGAINFDDGSHGMYNVDYADVFAPSNGASSALVYNTASAAIQYVNGCTRLAYSGIPFETIYPRATRQIMMTRLIDFLGACLPPDQALHKIYLPVILNNNVTVEPVCSDIIVNGGFESGDFTGWSRPSQNPPGAIVTDTVLSGSYAARIGAATIADPITTTSYSSIKQSLSIPANALTATLSLARYRWSGDTSGDRQYLAVLRPGQPVDYLFSGGVADAGWNSVSFDLKSYAGQTIDLLFSVMNNGAGGSTGMALDDVQLQMCVPQ